MATGTRFILRLPKFQMWRFKVHIPNPHPSIPTYAYSTPATAGGWSIERHQHVALGEGVEGKMFAAFIGWPSVDAHMAFRKTPEFAAVIPLFREGIKGTAVHHVGFERRV